MDKTYNDKIYYFKQYTKQWLFKCTKCKFETESMFSFYQHKATKKCNGKNNYFCMMRNAKKSWNYFCVRHRLHFNPTLQLIKSLKIK